MQRKHANFLNEKETYKKKLINILNYEITLKLKYEDFLMEGSI